MGPGDSLEGGGCRNGSAVRVFFCDARHEICPRCGRDTPPRAKRAPWNRAARLYRGYSSGKMPFWTGIPGRFWNSGWVYLVAPNCRSTSMIGQNFASLLNNLYINEQRDPSRRAGGQAPLLCLVMTRSSPTQGAVPARNARGLPPPHQGDFVTHMSRSFLSDISEFRRVLFLNAQIYMNSYKVLTSQRADISRGT